MGWRICPNSYLPRLVFPFSNFKLKTYMARMLSVKIIGWSAEISEAALPAMMSSAVMPEYFRFSVELVFDLRPGRELMDLDEPPPSEEADKRRDRRVPRWVSELRLEACEMARARPVSFEGAKN